MHGLPSIHGSDWVLPYLLGVLPSPLPSLPSGPTVYTDSGTPTNQIINQEQIRSDFIILHLSIFPSSPSLNQSPHRSSSLPRLLSAFPLFIPLSASIPFSQTSHPLNYIYIKFPAVHVMRQIVIGYRLLHDH